MMAFLISFFFIWNIGLSSRVVGAVLAIHRGNWLAGVMELGCPLWIAGIVVPIWLSYTQAGTVAALTSLVSIIVPYTISILRACVLVGADAEQFFTHGTVSQSYGLRGRLLGIPEPPAPEPLAIGDPVPPELLLIRKAKSREEGEELDVEQQDSESSGASNDKSEVLLPANEVCGICLDEYKEGDEIAFSRSPTCRHLFHASCLQDWLSTRERDMQVCPVCRESYHIDSSSDEDQDEREQRETTVQMPRSTLADVQETASRYLLSPTIATATLTDDLELGGGIEEGQRSHSGVELVFRDGSVTPQSHPNDASLTTTLVSVNDDDARDGSGGSFDDDESNHQTENAS